MRAERDSGSEVAELINTIIKEGKIVPVAITCGLIKKAMENNGWSKNRYLIDGFPRNEDNYTGWQEVMGDSVELASVIVFDADEDTMTERIMGRAAAATEKRNDDNLETLKKRFATFQNEQVPIIKRYEELGKVVRINALQGVDDVHAEVVTKLGL